LPLEQAALPLLLQIALKCRGAAGTQSGARSGLPHPLPHKLLPPQLPCCRLW
jgi:hypothetical protein